MDYCVSEMQKQLNRVPSLQAQVMDQAIREKLRIEAALNIYDIGCQWVIHHRRRFQECPGLEWPDWMEMYVAVGKFHLGAHRDNCFSRFSLNFMLGTGHLDGEILETLWSFLNKAAGPTRAMTKAHRSEVLDDLMQDSNFKKMVKLRKMDS